MTNFSQKFYRNFYLKTNGFIPTKPLNQDVFPGDFFQIRNGEMIPLGNIYREGIIDKDDAEFGYGIQLNPASWDFHQGVTKPYSGKESGHNPLGEDFEFSKQVMSFKSPGSFMFKGNNPESVKILNWNDLGASLIIKLTQVFYSFREVYVVTECATTSDWTLAIASSEKGELEIAANSENYGLTDIFGHSDAKTIQSKDIEYYHREDKRKPSFFRAKKLVIQNERLDQFANQMITEREFKHDWASQFFDYNFEFEPINYQTPISPNTQACLLDMLKANELNPNTALLYFRWEDANLDDVEKFFISYGE
ncbi:MAG: hypothetical protein KDD63_09450 [Bacteroidetes bacterium]|nr:hypothetical protein [Bacteroidota bacterium]